MNDTVKSASRVLDMLDLFTTTLTPIGVSEIARQLGIPKSSAHGLLGTLEARGYIVREDNLFVLAPELRFGKGLVEGPLARLIQVAGSTMRAVADECGESAFVSVLTPDRQHIKYVAKAVTSNEVRYDAELTHPRPAYATSSGIVMLAHRPQNEVDDFLARVSPRQITRRTVTDIDELRRVIAKAKRDGFAESSDANVTGATGISTPILGRDNYAIAAFALVAPTWRYKESRPRLRKQVTAGAAEIMRNMRGDDVSSAAAAATQSTLNKQKREEKKWKDGNLIG